MHVFGLTETFVLLTYPNSDVGGPEHYLLLPVQPELRMHWLLATVAVLSQSGGGQLGIGMRGLQAIVQSFEPTVIDSF